MSKGFHHAWAILRDRFKKIFYRPIAGSSGFDERFAKVFAINPVTIALTDVATGLILDINEAGCRMLGFCREELVGRTSLEIKMWPSLEARDHVVRELVGKKFFHDWEMPFYRRSGEAFTALMSGALMEWHGGPVAITTMLDISHRSQAEEALRKSEARFRVLAEAMPQMAFITDAAGAVVYYNPRFCDYIGQRRNAEGDELASDMIHPDDMGNRNYQWSESLRTGALYQIEYRLRRYDGQYRWHLGRALPVRGLGGEITQWLGTITDIHDQKVFAAKLQTALQGRNDFLSIASHELKTPLTSLKLQAQLINRMIHSPEMTTARWATVGEQIDRQVNRLVRLVDDMLDVTRFEAGKFSLDPEECALSEIVLEAVERIEPQMLAEGTKPIVEVIEEVRGAFDRFRMEQVVINLLTNAMRYGAAKPVIIRVQKQNGKALLSVQDAGIGISKDNQKRIFERFERGALSSTPNGLGLGLFISREIVQLHGGRIWVESELGLGSTFFVSL